ncbi:helix-turn-helix domain-containing protein [Streptomyces niveus]|uniref:helix-turn-helix domain-containing protein n=1 Tax=Streptomyces niveus TaxID=193462 RepID=UPI00344A71A2
MTDATHRKALTIDEVLALPVMFEVWPTLGAALNIGRTATYDLARTGNLPIPVIRVGGSLRARRSDLLDFLRICEENDDGAGADTPAPSVESSNETTTKRIGTPS